MLISVSTRKFGRAVRLPEAGVWAAAGSRLSKSAVSRRFKALTEARLAEWMATDLSQHDLLVIQIDGLHLDNSLLMIGAVGVDAEGNKHPLGVVQGATKTTLRKIRKELKRSDKLVLSMDDSLDLRARATYAYVQSLWIDEDTAPGTDKAPAPKDAPADPTAASPAVNG